MAPSLRSASRTSPYQSRQPTPISAQAGVNSSPVDDHSRPRKQRRTGRPSRAATDSGLGEQPQAQESENKAVNDANEKDLALQSEWVEPPIREPVPSYQDTPWSNVSTQENSMLGTMQALGVHPTATDRKKAGISSTRASSQPISTSEVEQNGERDNRRPKASSSEKGNAVSQDVSRSGFEEDSAALTEHPVPSSTEINVGKIVTTFKALVDLAAESKNRVLSRALVRVFKNSVNDPFLLSVLNGAVQPMPARNDLRAFQVVLRRTLREISTEADSAPPHTGPTAGRSGSVSSSSSLSSAKSLDAETFAPGISNTPRTPGHKKRALETDPEEAMQAKRARLQENVPDFIPRESGIRSSLARAERSSVSPPGHPAAVNGSERLTPAKSNRVAGKKRKVSS